VCVAAARAQAPSRGHFVAVVLVPDQLAAKAGEDGRTLDQACSVLLVAAGREPSDAPFVWKHGAADRGATFARGVEIGR